MTLAISAQNGEPLPEFSDTLKRESLRGYTKGVAEFLDGYDARGWLRRREVLNALG
jgi:hypothetical protein